MNTRISEDSGVRGDISARPIEGPKQTRWQRVVAAVRKRFGFENELKERAEGEEKVVGGQQRKTTFIIETSDHPSPLKSRSSPQKISKVVRNSISQSNPDKTDSNDVYLVHSGIALAPQQPSKKPVEKGKSEPKVAKEHNPQEMNDLNIIYSSLSALSKCTVDSLKNQDTTFKNAHDHNEKIQSVIELLTPIAEHDQSIKNIIGDLEDSLVKGEIEHPDLNNISDNLEVATQSLHHAISKRENKLNIPTESQDVL